ncbi:LysR family transcriptional regulator [Pseudonocardiaceae bacterium YIM PH 21723]|nr:LysR family transcriptional regulator [Pseudonocardiaceae bacterium YIM PH 21723]
MELQVLRWFQSVAEGATVTETAELSHITQPALSRALARLEAEIGTPLLTRTGRSLRLTPAGRVFKRHVDQMLDQYDLGLRAVGDLVNPESGLVPLAFLHTMGTWLVPRLISGFRAQHPSVRFELHQREENSILQELLDGAVDLIITSDDPGHPQVRWQRLLIEPLRLAVPQGHRLAQRKRIRLAEVADEPFILLRHGWALRDVTERLCAAAGFQPKIAFEGEGVSTSRSLVGAGLGIALLPPPHTARIAELGEVAPAVHLDVTDPGSSRDIGLAWLADRPLPAACSAFREHVSEATQSIIPAGYGPQPPIMPVVHDF